MKECELEISFNRCNVTQMCLSLPEFVMILDSYFMMSQLKKLSKLEFWREVELKNRLLGSYINIDNGIQTQYDFEEA